MQPYAHIIVNGKSFKHALSLFKGMAVNIAWIIRADESEIRFILSHVEKIFILSPFAWGDPLSILSIHDAEGYKNITISLPVVCKRWDGDRSLRLSSSVVDKLVKVIPDEDTLMDFVVYKENDAYIVLKSKEFSVCIHGVEGFHALYR